MGRVKSKYPKGNFVFKSSKPNAKGERALYLQYIVNTCFYYNRNFYQGCGLG